MTQRSLAMKHNVGKTTIYKIAHGVYLPVKEKPPGFVVIHDPAEKGAFNEGAAFSDEAVRLMLKDNVFTPGTKLASGGRNYVIRIVSKLVSCV